MLKSFFVYEGRHILLWFYEQFFTFYVLATVLDADNILINYYF